MLQKIQSYINENQLLDGEKTVIVAMSGGADSVALWHILSRLGYDCVMAHCNFHLRGEESNRDEEFVRRLAEKHQTPFYKIDFDTTKYAAENGISIEMAARDLRYEWFYILLADLQAQAIAVAHHADDNIETMLMNLTRGTGLRGLTGISNRNGKVVRPLLCCSRKEIERYLFENGLNYVEDSTNKLNDYQRNKIRNQVIPLLEEINPSVRQTLYDTFERFADAYDIYSEKIDFLKKEIVLYEPDCVKIDIEKLKKQTGYKTILFEILHSFGFNSVVVRQISETLCKESGKQFFSGTHCLLKDRDQLIIYKKQQTENESYLIHENTKEIHEPIELQFEKIERTADFQVSKEKNIIHLDFAKLQFPLTLRKWREGDVFQPFGLKGKKKVSDFFIDNKLSLLEKKSCWLLLSGNEIVWLVGYRTDHRFRVTEKTKEIMKISISAYSL
jgi:tRNA(Ile)-lysidine synthase